MTVTTLDEHLQPDRAGAGYASRRCWSVRPPQRRSPSASSACTARWPTPPVSAAAKSRSGSRSARRAGESSGEVLPEGAVLAGAGDDRRDARIGSGRAVAVANHADAGAPIDLDVARLPRSCSLGRRDCERASGAARARRWIRSPSCGGNEGSGRESAIRRTTAHDQSRVSSGGSVTAAAVWSPDGTRLAFRSNRTGMIGLYERSAAGGGGDRPLLPKDFYRTSG